MKFRTSIVSILISLIAIAAPVALISGPAQASASYQSSTEAQVRTCTKTSSGTCIRGGQFCPQASYNRNGWDAMGRRYVCKGDRQHPHWMKP